MPALGGMNDGRVCMLGAMTMVSRPALLAHEATERLRRATRGDPVRWNDAKGRTQEQVIAKLREVAQS